MQLKGRPGRPTRQCRQTGRGLGGEAECKRCSVAGEVKMSGDAVHGRRKLPMRPISVMARGRRCCSGGASGRSPHREVLSGVSTVSGFMRGRRGLPQGLARGRVQPTTPWREAPARHRVFLFSASWFFLGHSLSVTVRPSGRTLLDPRLTRAMRHPPLSPAGSGIALAVAHFLWTNGWTAREGPGWPSPAGLGLHIPPTHPQSASAGTRPGARHIYSARQFPQMFSHFGTNNVRRHSKAAAAGNVVLAAKHSGGASLFRTVSKAGQVGQ